MDENAKKALLKALMTLDRLQVELHEETLYKTPSPEETRERVLKAMDAIETAIGITK